MYEIKVFINAMLGLLSHGRFGENISSIAFFGKVKYNLAQSKNMIINQ